MRYDFLVTKHEGFLILGSELSTKSTSSFIKAETGKTKAQRLGEAGFLIGCVSGLVLTMHSIATYQPLKGLEYLERYVFWPVALFLAAGFLTLTLRVLHFAIFREWLSSLSETPFRESCSGSRKLSRNAYVFALFVASLVGAYFTTTNFLMLVTGQIFVALQHR